MPSTKFVFFIPFTNKVPGSIRMRDLSPIDTQIVFAIQDM